MTGANLNKKNVTVDGDYTLALSGVSAPTQTKAAGFDGSAYKTATISDGYTASGNTISYTPASGGSTLFTLTNATISDAIKVDTSKKTVTLTAANLNKKNVTVDNNYTLKLASDVDTTKETINKWTTLNGGNVAYLANGAGEYYSVEGKKVTYNAEVAGTKKVELSGVKGTPTLKSGVVSLKAGNFKSNVALKSNAGDYTFNLSGKFGGKTFTGTSGADTIKSSGSNLLISGGKGNDKITLGSGKTYTLSGNKLK